MISTFGYLTLALAFLLAVYGLFAVVLGLVQKSAAWTESARLALLLIFPLVTVSLVVLTMLLVGQRFDVAYVYSVTSSEMPIYLRLTAVWGGQSGSLLFWSWLVAGFSLFFALRKWRDEPDLLPWSLLVVFLTLAFFLMVNVFMETPFERFWHMPDGSRVLSVLQPVGAWSLVPQDGQGLNPLLRHPGMIWHPPTLYLGFIGFIIPFALAVSSLASGRRDRRWVDIARPWMLIAWVFLTLGLVLGMRWAYDILGWGGYWGWDPVEIAALLPWLSATAWIHTAILQRRKNHFKRWNLVLVILTFVFVIFGTFITRSGVLSSVHAFAGSEIGLPMFIYTAFLSLGSLGLLVYRWRDLHTDYAPSFGFTKETLTLFSNLILLSILMVCFLGVIYPIISELLTDTQITVGPAWYKRITGPLLILQLFLVGICPLAGWSLTNLTRWRKHLWVLLPISLLAPLAAWFFGDVRGGLALLCMWLVSFSVGVLIADYLQGAAREKGSAGGNILSALWSPIQRNHRRYGGMLVHLGIVLLSLGIIGIEGLQQETQSTLSLGETVNLGGYSFKFEGLEHFEEADGRLVTEALLSITRDGKPIGALYPQREIYPNMGLAITQPGLRSNLAVDLYAVLIDWRPISQDEATFRVFINPLVTWLWVGTGVVTLGTVVALLPDKLRRK
ncbi:MAG: cytochrome c biogenesis protein CcsA [Brevefilum sp.]|nr:cytochrome c biogenesis protein CcsA [Brevefilum sp.]